VAEFSVTPTSRQHRSHFLPSQQWWPTERQSYIQTRGICSIRPRLHDTSTTYPSQWRLSKMPAVLNRTCRLPPDWIQCLGPVGNFRQTANSDFDLRFHEPLGVLSLSEVLPAPIHYMICPRTSFFRPRPSPVMCLVYAPYSRTLLYWQLVVQTRIMLQFSFW